MPKKRGKARELTLTTRQIQVQSVGLSVSHRAEKPRGLPPVFESDSWLEIRGVADEAVCDVRDIAIGVHLEEGRDPGPGEPPSVGGIIQVRSRIDAVVALPETEFDRVWSLGLAQQLRHCWVAFTEPKRSRARIVSISFGNEAEE